MQVKLVRRWGPNPAGRTVDVDNTQGRWLVAHAYGAASGEPSPQPSGRVHPGTDGPDPLAGGDATRHGNPAMVKGERRGNNALPVAGSPVQYNAGIRPDDARPRVVTEGGEDPARGQVSDQHEPAASDRPAQTGRRRKAATPEQDR